MTTTLLRTKERDKIQALLRVYRETILAEDPYFSFPFRVLAQTALAQRGCALGPLLDGALRERVQKTVVDERLNKQSATELHGEILRALAPERVWRTIPAIVCPLIGLEVGATMPSAEERCCTKRDYKPGCDADAGTIYNAKTNGLTVWYSAQMFAPESARPANNFGALGLAVRTKAGHVLLHEMGHVLHLHEATNSLFARVEQWYLEAASLVPIDMIQRGNVVVDLADTAEFVATAFAMDNERQETVPCN